MTDRTERRRRRLEARSLLDQVPVRAREVLAAVRDIDHADDGSLLHWWRAHAPAGTGERTPQELADHLVTLADLGAIRLTVPRQITDAGRAALELVPSLAPPRRSARPTPTPSASPTSVSPAPPTTPPASPPTALPAPPPPPTPPVQPEAPLQRCLDLLPGSQADVLRAMAGGAQTRRALREALPAMPRGTLSGALSKLVRRGVICTVRRGSYRLLVGGGVAAPSSLAGCADEAKPTRRGTVVTLEALALGLGSVGPLVALTDAEVARG